MESENQPGPSRARLLLDELAQLEVSQQSVPLSQVATQTNSAVKEEIALREEKLRRRLSYSIAGMFGGLNIVTILVICWLADLDQSNLAAKLIPVAGRIIDTRVIMSLLGATTVQLGTIAVIMARFVFREHD